MPLPQPPVALDNVCSVIFNNTLYTYSTAAFQALPLSAGGNWTQLPQGEKVTGGVCVGSTPANAQQAGFYVVGGKGETADYKGLQKFTYATGKWESITPTSVVTQDRLWHGATYLNASDSILMYAGAQDGSQNPSTQTFTISASAPFEVTAFESIAPPAINPILMPWSNDQAVFIGGSTTNTQVMVFSPVSSWVDSGASLAVPLPKDISAVKAALVKGDDGCKNLYTFDMTVAPNKVERVQLVDGNGTPVRNAVAITKREQAKEKRVDVQTLTADSWPGYNSTLAPTATRSNYAVAEDSDGVVVIAGGNTQDVLCIFDGRQNGWENATARFAEQKVFAADFSSSSSATTLETATSTPAASTTVPATTSASATTTPAALGNGSQSSTSSSPIEGTSTQAILGAVLGSIAGVGLILALLYFCVMRKKKRQAHMEAGHARRASGVSSNEKDAIGFASDSFPHSPGLSTFRGHQQQDSQGSFSSMAILMGRANGNKGQNGPGGVARNPSNNSRRDSGDSTFRAFKSTISKPMIQPTQEIGLPPPRPETRDDRGVSFAADTAKPRPRPPAAAAAIDREDSTRRSSGWNRYWSGGSALNILGYGNKNNQDSRRTTKDSDGSNYSDPHRITQDSATVPPLNVYEPRASFSRVNSGSPTITQFKAGRHEGMSGHIERPVSAGSDRSGYSSGIPTSVHEAWDPTAANKPWGADRATTASSFYSSFTPLAPSRAAPPNQPPYAPSRPPTGVSQQPQLAMASTSSDMSWLNLGDGPRL
ncbi:hypothetical protein GQ53DRAFT_406009 [Thozetella sp. PMI_491]|nr:hypothetical protein GQ53DRAFT_406009 [Thozetella sp. PMI_491]